MEMLHDVIAFEDAVLQAVHPHQTQDIISELRCMLASIHYWGDWTLFRRVLCLMRRARVITYQLCDEYVERCALLVAAVNKHQHIRLCRSKNDGSDCIFCRPFADELVKSLLRYDAVELAIAACDDVLPYLRPQCKSFYIQNLRPCMIAFMADSYADDSGPVQPAAKRVCARVNK
jgi:hypothetical protein